MPAARPGDPGDRTPLHTWFLNFLQRELAAYPGRVSLVTRMVLGATLTMLIIMTFHLPGGALGGYFALIVSRESLRNTVQQIWLTIAFFCLATVYTLAGIAIFVDSPITHFFWVIGSFYLIFFVMGTARNYGLAAGFSFLIATAIPIWDRAGDVNLKVALTLYTLLSVIVGVGCTLFVEYVYRAFHPVDPILLGVADRLQVAGETLQAIADVRLPSKPVQSRLLQYAMVGPSSLRRQFIRAGITAEIRARVSAVIAISGRVVELCATALATESSGRVPTQHDAERLRSVGGALLEQAAEVRALQAVEEVGQSQVPGWKGSGTRSAYLPILPELERSVGLLGDIANSFGVPLEEQEITYSGVEAARQKVAALATMLGAHPSKILAADAFTNREHLVFALRGCLAATMCYLIYNGIDWPGINTSVATCIITALGTIGSSRQKQLLRVAGAVVGGFVISLPAQVFLLPLMDSITAFTIFFVVVSGIAAWFATSSPRLSYFGLQIALAFYLVNLQEPTFQTSLSVARDRVVGVLLGLLMMWLVFDQIAAPLATVRMGDLLRGNLDQLAEFALTINQVARDASGKPEENSALARFRQLRDKINDSFSQTNAQADAVVFEFGPRRVQRLWERERMEAMQPSMRSIFLLEIALFESDQLPGALIGQRDAASTAAVAQFLGQAHDALCHVAALPVPGTADEDAVLTHKAEAAVLQLQEGHTWLEKTVDPKHETLRSLSASLVFSIHALLRAATTRRTA
ncbi:hypothetical protein D1Y84_02405 [Acidipila sp. EB88]|nr:hypothetical protein D1Y84_02405 [Acidipila sp. EB88]